MVDRRLRELQARRRSMNAARQRAAVIQQLAARRGPVRVSPVVARRQAERRRGEEDRQSAADRAITASRERYQGKDDDDGGGIFGNSIVGGIMRPIGEALNVIDLPRRVIISGIQEAADAVNGGDASWSDFTDQIGDRNFGFGDVVGSTGNRWLDRFIGFAGDVALDPTTYLTLGSSKVAGAGGRLAAAADAAGRGASEELVDRLGRIGTSALTRAERETFELPRAGLRFGLPSHNVRLPGTEGLGEALEGGLARLRGQFTDTALGRGARRLGVSRAPATRDLTERLATGIGRGSAEGVSATDAANVLAANRAERGAAQMTRGRLARGVNKATRQYAGRTELTHALESGVDNADTKALKVITDRIARLYRDVGAALSPREHYAPHYLTDDFNEFLNRVSEGGLHGVGLGSGSGRLDARVFQPNSDITVNGVPIHLDDASAKDITAKFQAAFPDLAGKKLIEDDPGVWLPRLVMDASRDIGERTMERRLMRGGTLRAQGDASTLETVPDTAATKEANEAMATRFQQEVAALAGQRDVLGREVNRRLQGAATNAQQVAGAVQGRAQELNEEAATRLAQGGRVAEYARGEMDRAATEGEQRLAAIEERIAQLDAEEASLRQQALSERRQMNRARAAGYRQRLAAVQAERAQLREEAIVGRLAAQERDPVRKQLGRATARQTELAARVGEGPLGAERLATGETLPQRAEADLEQRVASGIEQRADQLERLAQIRERRADPEELTRLASELAGREVRSPQELSREVQRLGGITAEAREARVGEAIGTGLTRKHSRALTPTDRLAAKRQLTREQLAEPDVLSDEVTNAAPPEIVEEFYDTQVALADALRPYRQSNLPDDVAADLEARPTMESAELNARRQELTSQIEQLEVGIARARRYRDNDLAPRDRMESFMRTYSQQRNQLLRELDQMVAVETPRRIAAMADMNVVELADRAARLADFMVRYANGVRRGGTGEGVAVRATREALEQERRELEQRLRYRLSLERNIDPADLQNRTADFDIGAPREESVARFADDDALDAEVERRWQRELSVRADEAAPRRVGREGKARPRARAGESEQAFKERVRNELRGARDVRPDPKALANRETAAAFELEQVVDELIAPVRESARNLKRFQRLVETGEVNPASAGALMEQADVNDLLSRGQVGVRQIESQLSARVFEQQQAYADSLGKLLGRRLQYKDAVKYAKRGDDKMRRMADALGEMTPGARARFDQHVRMQSVLDQRRLRDVNERLARMGEATGQREVTDMWQEVLTASPQRLIQGGTMRPRDLSQLTDPNVLADVQAERQALGQARSQLGAEAEAARSELLPAQLPEMQRAGFERQLQDIAATNQAERAAGSRRVRDLSQVDSELRAEELAGRTARDELRTRGTVDDDMARRLEGEVAPFRGRAEEAERQIGEVGDVRTMLTQQYEQLDEQVRNDISAATSLMEVARGEQIRAAVDVADTERMVEQATRNLKSVQGWKPQVPVNVKGKRQRTPTDAYRQTVEQVRAAIESGADDETVQLLDSAARITAQMAKIDAKQETANRMLAAAKKREFVQLTKDVLAPGLMMYRSKVAGEDFIIREEVDRAIKHMNEVLWKEPTAMWKAIDSYTQFFKAYATATPGFHVRNAISATFMNGADGVSVENMIGGTRIWRAWEKYGDLGDDWVEKVPARYREHAQAVVDAVYGSGAGGQFGAGEIGQRAYGGRQGRVRRLLNENKWLKGSQRAGEYVEGAVRAGMALDTLRGAGERTRMVGGRAARRGTTAEAIARVNRIHFNYSDVGEQDAMMRRAVPFWTFLSRNVPLQIQQLVLKPRSYNRYQSFVRNMSEGMEQDDLPEYMRKGGGFRFAEGLGLMPQLGLTNLSESVEQLTTPSRMLAQANPLVKAPIQAMTNYNAYYNQPYGENELERLSGPESALQPLLSLLGATEGIPGGGVAAPKAYTDAARDLLPPLAQVRRFMGEDRPNDLPGEREDRIEQTWLNFLGVPVRALTPGVLARERRRRSGEAYYGNRDRQALQRALAEL